MTDGTAPGPEFTRRIEVARLGGRPAAFDIAAAEAERAALARRFGLAALDRLEARVTLAPLPGGLLRLTATLSAEVVQHCVATLEPVASRIEESFTLLYGAEAEEAATEVVVSGEAELVEPLVDGAVDIGETVAQQLSLALDPFPRAPGAEAASAEAGAANPSSPFAALAKWREKG